MALDWNTVTMDLQQSVNNLAFFVLLPILTQNVISRVYIPHVPNSFVLISLSHDGKLTKTCSQVEESDREPKRKEEKKKKKTTKPNLKRSIKTV